MHYANFLCTVYTLRSYHVYAIYIYAYVTITHIHTYIHMYPCMHTHTHKDTHTHAHTHTHTFETCVRTHKCIYIYTYINTYAYTHIPGFFRKKNSHPVTVIAKKTCMPSFPQFNVVTSLCLDRKIQPFPFGCRHALGNNIDQGVRGDQV